MESASSAPRLDGVPVVSYCCPHRRASGSSVAAPAVQRSIACAIWMMSFGGGCTQRQAAGSGSRGVAALNGSPGLPRSKVLPSVASVVLTAAAALSVTVMFR